MWWYLTAHFDFVSHAPHILDDMLQQLLAQYGAPLLGMLLDAFQQWTQIYAHTSDVMVFAHLIQGFHNARVKCKFLIDFDKCHLALHKLLAYNILLKGPQIEVLAKSDTNRIIGTRKYFLDILQAKINLYSLRHKALGFVHNFCG